MPSEDPEKQFERGLARHLRRGSQDAACPDAEMLAAYHERTFSQEEMEQWKQHIAGCARCQETLALVESSEVAMREEWPQVVAAPGYRDAVMMRAQEATAGEKEAAAGGASQVVTRSEKNAAARRRILRWSAPAGAIAALALLWLGLRHPQNTGTPRVRTETQVAENRNSQSELARDDRLYRNEAKAADEKSAAAPTAKKFAPENYAALGKDTAAKPDLPSMQMPEPLPGRARGAAAASGGINGAVAGDKIARDRFDKQLQPERETTRLSRPSIPGQKSEGFGSGNGPAAAPPPAPPPLSPAPLSSPQPQAAGKIADQSATGTGTTADAVAGFGSKSTPTPAKPKATNKAKEEGSSNATQTVEVVSAAPVIDSTSATQQTTIETHRNLPLNGRNYTDLMSLAPGVASNVIAAPKGKYGWRVGAAGLIEHSSDYGKTWKPQKSGVTADLISGSAPGEKICWVVGKAGTLLLTTDGGKHWKTVKAPVGSDLDRVQASDALHATIWSKGNREVQETNNGGLSWTPAPQD